jgi:pimeloyl-ACP methyl ester carboxylesterase
MKNIITGIFAFMMFASCHKEEITISKKAEDVFFLDEKGVSMPIRVYGNTASKTFMLMVHGGPGNDALIYRNDYVKKNVETEFAMVYWDQRSAGASQGNSTLPESKFEDVVVDLEKVITLLKHRYGSNISIFLNGHSWGGFLTPYYLAKGNNQNNIKGWIQTDGAHDFPLLNIYAKEMLIKKASTEIVANRNVTDWNEIKTFCDNLILPTTPEKSLELNEFANNAGRLSPEVEILYNRTALAKLYIANNYPLTNANIFPWKPGKYNDDLFKKLSQGTDLPARLNSIKIPALVLFGEWDFICPPKLADDLMSKIGSSYKKKVIFPRSEHSPMLCSDEPQYWSEIKTFVNRFK